MFARRVDRIAEAIEERQAASDGSRAWLREQLGLIRERREAAEDRLPEEERQAARVALDADHRAARLALAATASTPEEAERLAELAEASGDPDDSRRAMLAHIRLIVARSEREQPTPLDSPLVTPQTPPTADTDR